MDAVNKNLKSKAFMIADRTWPSLMMRKSFHSNAMQGMLFALGFSAIVLIISSRSVLMTLFSLVCIFNVLLTLMTFIYILDWRFGLTESIGMIVFIGLSVDYVIHICHSYSHAVDETRKGKTFYSVHQMGSTIISGALTSCMAGVFLVNCQTYALNKFGFMILITIASAVVNSIFIFPSLLFIWGPESKHSSNEAATRDNTNESVKEDEMI